MVALRTAAGGPTTERRLTGELDGGDTPGMQMLNEALTLLVEAVDHTAE